MPDFGKQPSRTSQRTRTNVNYTSLASGIGDVSASLDYNEVSASSQSAKGSRRGVKTNPDVLKQVQDFWSALNSSEEFRKLNEVAIRNQNAAMI